MKTNYISLFRLTKKLSFKSNIIITNSEIIDYIEISEILTAITTQISLNCDIIELITSIRKNIHY